MSPEFIHPTPEDLFGYRDGELPPDRRFLVEAHVLGCSQCSARLEAMSAAEADLRSRPEDVDDAYYARMAESVMGRIGAGAPESPGPARVERRRPEPMPDEEPRRSKTGSWLGIAGTVAAAAAVVVVVAILARHQGDWVRAPRPGVLGRPESKNAPAQPRAPLASKPAPATPPATPPAMTPATPPTAARTMPPSVPGEPSSEKDRAAKMAYDRARADESRAAAPSAGKPLVKTQSAEEAIGAAAAVADIAQSASGEEYQRLVRSRGLPVTWDPGVGREALLGAEGPLRDLYMSGRAGQDSARIRLYLAEAERLRLGSPNDSAAVDRILHHYWRAIRLAEGDAALSAIARRRLFDFQRVVGERP